MSSYSFRLDQFRVDKTRSRHHDTDVLTIKLEVGERSSTHDKLIDDVNDGNFDVGFEFNGIQIDDPNTPITLTYNIANQGHDADAIAAELVKTLDKLAQVGGDAKGADPAGLAEAMFVMDSIFDLLNADCDGPVAADNFKALRSDFDALIPPGGRVFTNIKRHDGVDSHAGCGGNSVYKVTVTIIRTEANDVNQPDPTKKFIILSRSSGLVLDVRGGSHDDGAAIIQNHDDGTESQHWELIPVDDHFFQVRSSFSGLVLDVKGGSHDDEAQIIQFHPTGGLNQHWEFELIEVPPLDALPPFNQGSLFFKIRSRLSGKLLEVPGRSAEPIKGLQQFSDVGGNNQLWQLISVGDVAP
jgi:hypothetical protein